MAESETDLTTSTSFALYLFKDRKVGQWIKLRCKLKSWNRVFIQYSLTKFVMSISYINTKVLITKKTKSLLSLHNAEGNMEY